MLWFRKLAAVLAIAAGVSMILLPFPDELTGEREREVVWLEIGEAAPADGPGAAPVPRVTRDELAGYPTLAAAVEALVAGGSAREAAAGVAPAELSRFHRRVLDDRGIRPSFIVDDVLVEGGTFLAPVQWTFGTPWLPVAARVVGSAALLVGLVLLAGTYRIVAARTGIPVASRAIALFCDLVLVAGGVFAVGVTIDAVWVELVGQPSLLGLEPEWPSDQTFTALHFVALPALLVALPVLTLYFTSLSSQRVRVDAGGVTTLGAIGSASIGWDELEDVRLGEQSNPASFTVVDFRSLQRVLELEGGGRTLTVNEPSSRTRKRVILDALRTYAPPEKVALIDAAEGW